MKEKTTYAFIKAEEEWKVYVIRAVRNSSSLGYPNPLAPPNNYLLIADYYKSFSLWYGAANNSSQDLSSTITLNIIILLQIFIKIFMLPLTI